MDISKLLAERLQELLIENNLKATKLADNIGCKKSTIYNYLNGAKLPSLEMSIKLANYFKCTMENLIGIELENYTNEFFPCPPFNVRLEFLLKYYNISRYKLRTSIGVSESMAYYWAKGNTKPSFENIIKIAEYLNCPIDFVIGRTRG